MHRRTLLKEVGQFSWQVMQKNAPGQPEAENVENLRNRKHYESGNALGANSSSSPTGFGAMSSTFDTNRVKGDASQKEKPCC